MKNRKRLLLIGDTVRSTKKILFFMVILLTAVTAHSQSSQSGMATQEMKDEGLCAAHSTFVIGSKARVSNAANGKEIEVTITRRIVPSSSRIIDLSPAAARELGLGSEGWVNISPIQRRLARPMPSEPPPEPLLLGEEMLKRAVSTNPTNTWGNKKQKGQWTTSNNISAILFDNSSMYFGNFLGGNMNGKGIYIAPEGFVVNNCPKAKYYVGNWSNNIKSGTGSCYDVSGKLIYDGEFKDDKPTGTYPTTGSYASYKFQTIDNTNGDKYIGETKDGKRHGYGVYAWKDGGIWIGPWENGVRAGRGISIASNGSLTTGSWDDNKHTPDTTVASNSSSSGSGSSGSSSSSYSSGSQSSGYSQNPDGTTTFRMPGYESTINPNTGYGTVTSTCAICSGTGRIQAINPMYGIGAANAISGGYANTTPMYTWQTCYMCNGLGKTTTTTYVDPNASSSGRSNGSSSSSGGSSRYSSNSGSTPSQSKCTFCKGHGERYGGDNPSYTGIHMVQSWCNICEENRFPHYHVRCSGCDGKGYR
jgi:hypothetical protein